MSVQIELLFGAVIMAVIGGAFICLIFSIGTTESEDD